MNIVSLILNLCGGSKLKAAAAVGGVFLVVVLGIGLWIHVGSLNAEIDQLHMDVNNLNATLVTEQGHRANAETRANLAEADEARLHNVIAGKDVQIVRLQKSKSSYIKRLAQAQEIDRQTVVVEPEKTSGVIDDATSNATVDYFNAVFLRTKAGATPSAASSDY